KQMRAAAHQRVSRAVAEPPERINAPAAEETPPPGSPSKDADAQASVETLSGKVNMAADAVAYLEASRVPLEPDSEPPAEATAADAAKLDERKADGPTPDSAPIVAPAPEEAPRAGEPTPSLVTPQPEAPPQQTVTPTRRLSPVAGILIGAAAGALVSA